MLIKGFHSNLQYGEQPVLLILINFLLLSLYTLTVDRFILQISGWSWWRGDVQPHVTRSSAVAERPHDASHH